ncbi:hypothetical protein GQ43DRAFT_471834 [Delitschia confertaspora ATCC 74209]|uniref:Aflatoxin regulatory protein domain-containing protein n=1 Tax=Delitschia confertaspora ATCC 74209 TaxID=1513339 RepID=A0A9P4MQ40_9PLEO|nr:hypothetical protein GQ43DRAFT_471834 [Delitschia confertaspora ATCC 74209]
MQWTMDSNSNGSEMDALEAKNVQHSHHSDSQFHNPSGPISRYSISSEAPIRASLEFNMEDLLRYPLDQAPYEVDHAASDSSTESDSKKRAEMDSQCMLVCCQIASELESYIHADIKSLRIILDIAKKGSDRVNDAMTLQQGSQTPRCMAMFVVVLYQIIQILESGCSCLSDLANQKSTVSTQINGMVPGLSLGGFGMEPEEQVFYRSQLVRKAIQQVSELLLKMKKLSGIGESGSNMNANTPEEREKCFADLESRLKKLINMVSANK